MTKQHSVLVVYVSTIIVFVSGDNSAVDSTAIESRRGPRKRLRQASCLTPALAPPAGACEAARKDKQHGHFFC